MSTMIGRRLARWALRAALLYALKKGIEIARRQAVGRGQLAGPRTRKASEASLLH